MTRVFVVLFLIVVLALIGVLVAWIISGPETPAGENYYGHPRPPVAALRARLPKPPASHVWEIKVTHDNCGEAQLGLALISLSTTKPVASTSTSLVRGGYPWDTWEEMYNNWSGLMFVGERRHRFDAKLIQPLVTWARREAAKVDKTDAVAEYWIGNEETKS